MDAVVDTNVVVSALTSRRGASNAVLQVAARLKFRLRATPPLFLEYEEVLKRPEHRLATGMSLEDIDRFLRGLAAIMVPVEVRFVWRPQLPDPDDEMVLEAAINGGANRIVTFNTRDFRAAGRFGVGIVTPAEFLEELKP
jgi:putative PIN family toxin of toxin-antitoxin system